MMRPQVDFTAEIAEDSEPSLKKLAFLIKRRKTVSVTPAMGARIVAGAMRTLPIWTDCGTVAATRTGGRSSRGPSQYFRILPIFMARAKNIESISRAAFGGLTLFLGGCYSSKSLVIRENSRRRRWEFFSLRQTGAPLL